MEENKRKRRQIFAPRMQKKLVVLFVIVLLAFAGLGARLVFIVTENKNEYQKQVLSQQAYNSVVIPFKRGDIYDANGTIMATSEKVYNLVVDAKVMTNNGKANKGKDNATREDLEKYIAPTMQALDEYFDLDIDKIREHVIKNASKSSWYVVQKRMSYEEVKPFKDAQAENSSIRGIWFEEEYKRLYPNGTMASDILGFTSRDSNGIYGLEEYYNEDLNGINGREYGYLEEDLTLERTLNPAIDGYNIHSTIDMNIQRIVEKHLLAFNEKQKNTVITANGAENVGCVIMDVDSGRVLAMAGYPCFDPNDTWNTDALLGTRMVEMVTNSAGYQELHKTNTYIDQNVIDQMDDAQLELNLQNLWKNFCITGTYEPGSTIKPFTVASALEMGAITKHSTFECKGSLEIGGYTIKCHNRDDGVLGLEAAVAKSCNVAMMKIAQIVGAEDFCEYQQNFNFGLKTNIDLAGEARTVNLIYNADDMGPTDLATNSFGQNFNVSMIQMISGFCSLINGGYYYEPHMVDKITNASGVVIENREPRVLKQTISESTSELIRQYCNAVVEYGTGKTARPVGYRIGGKTGTAETIDENTHKRHPDEYVVSFMGYAPADHPEIAIYVVVDRPNAAKQDDAKFATYLVRDILTEVLPYMNIYPTEEMPVQTEAPKETPQPTQTPVPAL